MRRHWTRLAVLALVFAALAAVTWRKWGHPFMDWGFDPYAAREILHGRILYRDICLKFGPLSKYLNAFWFQLFGDSLRTYIFANLALLALTAAVIYGAFTRIASPLTGLLCGLILLTCSGFSDFNLFGNYNFIFPYTHETILGAALSYGLLLFCTRALRRPGKTAEAFWAGAILGLIFLTKPEFFIGSFAATAATAILLKMSPSESTASFLKCVAAGMAGCLIPLAAFFAYFLQHMPASEALKAVAGAWDLGFIRQMSATPFYRMLMGLNDSRTFALKLAEQSLIAAAFCAALYGLDAWVAQRPRFFRGVMDAGLLLVLIYFACQPDAFALIFRALPAVMVWILITLSVTAWKHLRKTPRTASSEILLIPWAVYALFLLSKALLRSVLFGFGFVLVVPALLVIVAYSIHIVPAWLKERHGRGDLIKGMSTGLWAAMIASVMIHTGILVYRDKNYPVGQGADRLVLINDKTYPGAPLLADILEWMERHSQPADTLTMLPEGQIVNFLLKKSDPTRYAHALFVLMVADPENGEKRVLENLKTARPDFIIHTDITLEEHGVRFFGQKTKYGKDVMEWVRSEYDLVWEKTRSTPSQENLSAQIYKAKILDVRLKT